MRNPVTVTTVQVRQIQVSRGEGFLPLHLATERARGRNAHGSFPRVCSGSLTVASKTRLRCFGALASARHRQNWYLQGCEPRWIIFVIGERSYELSLRGNDTRKAIDCAVPHAPPVHMIELLQVREITLVGYPEEYDKSLER